MPIILDNYLFFFSFFSMISDIDLRCFVYAGYGKDFVKKQKMSPDAWIQMAFQLTFYRYCIERSANTYNYYGEGLMLLFLL